MTLQKARGRGPWLRDTGPNAGQGQKACACGFMKARGGQSLGMEATSQKACGMACTALCVGTGMGARRAKQRQAGPCPPSRVEDPTCAACPRPQHRHSLAVALGGPIVPLIVGLWLLCEEHLVEAAEAERPSGAQATLSTVLVPKETISHRLEAVPSEAGAACIQMPPSTSCRASSKSPQPRGG